MRMNKRGLQFCGIAVLLLAVLSAEAGTIKRKKVTPPLTIQGYRAGMTIKEVKQLLHKTNVKDYQTCFPDLFVYYPSPKTEMKLFFACSSKGQVLSRIQFSTEYASREAETAVPKFKQKLVSKYGTPLAIESQPDALDFCWGRCEVGSGGTKLEAKTVLLQGEKRALQLVLSNDKLANTCQEMRREKINQWLYGWIGYVRQFKLGMPLSDASVLYQRRHHQKMMPEEERDEEATGHDVMHFAVKDLDFFTGLDYESFAFEGQGPGSLVMKFTGTQAGRNSKLNRRLYYFSFSTTRFTDKHRYKDVQKKLNLFVKTYGSPDQLLQLEDGLTAVWQWQTKKMSLIILDSGLISVEQEDFLLKRAYREAAVKKTEEYNRTRFDRPIF